MNLLINGSDDETFLSWNSIIVDVMQEFSGHSGGINCFEVSGNMLVSGSVDGTLRSWDLNTGKLIRILKGITEISLV